MSYRLSVTRYMSLKVYDMYKDEKGHFIKTVFFFKWRYIQTILVLVITMTSFMIAADGFGANATGGTGGTIVVVSNSADFTTYATSLLPYIITVSNTITLDVGSLHSNFE